MSHVNPSGHDEILALGADAFVSPELGGERITYRERGARPGRVILARVLRRGAPVADSGLSSLVTQQRATVIVRNHPSLGVREPKTSDRMVVALLPGGDPIDVAVLGIVSSSVSTWTLEVGA